MWQSTTPFRRGAERRNFDQDTYVVQTVPWGLYVAARMLCQDGKIRAAHHVAETADTFFSVPASVKVTYQGQRYTVAGYLTYSEDHDNTGQTVIEFRHTYGRKNSHIMSALIDAHRAAIAQHPSNNSNTDTNTNTKR